MKFLSDLVLGWFMLVLLLLYLIRTDNGWGLIAFMVVCAVVVLVSAIKLLSALLGCLDRRRDD